MGLTDREEEEQDTQLRGVFQQAAFPPTPRLEPVVRRRVRRRRLVRRGSFIGLVLLAAIAATAWQWPARSTDGVVATVLEQPPDTEAIEVADLRVLFAKPPVDVFGQLSQQQAAFVAAVNQLKE